MFSEIANEQFHEYSIILSNASRSAYFNQRWKMTQCYFFPDVPFFPSMEGPMSEDKQARKLLATLVWNYDPATDSLTGVKCRATSVAKKWKVWKFIRPARQLWSSTLKPKWKGPLLQFPEVSHYTRWKV